VKDITLLGLKVRDRVTAFEGVVQSVCYDLYGCIQAVVTPGVKEGKLEDARWFDTKRLEVLSSVPVMEVPSFTVVPGGCEKSIPRGM
jgi:hypothetical protein